jgi:hypothetical protein
MANNREQKTHNTTNDKGVHPSLGLHLLVQLPMDLLYYFLKVLKYVLYNAQNVLKRSTGRNDTNGANCRMVTC